MDADLLDRIGVAMTVCDERGVVTGQNAASAEVFARNWGGRLVGRDLRLCHPPPAREKLDSLLAEPRLNAYTIEKAGRRKLIYQAPLYREGKFAGYVELSFPIPDALPHFVRK